MDEATKRLGTATIVQVKTTMQQITLSCYKPCMTSSQRTLFSLPATPFAIRL
jgi:hypothetical protein